MKYSSRIILVLFFSALFFSACKQTTIVKTKTPPPGQVKKANKPLPPGQAKKVTGSKSAAPYAPGQQNKTSKSKQTTKAKEDKGNEKKD
ncbi:MAG TPA: hypothetical protein VFU05_13450 [Cyclobacteriaceae bacterium]|nr:hypothetical protein [Cyclobacteriaceae bacterium]